MVEDKKGKLNEILALAIANKASDIHLVAGSQPLLRVNGNLLALTSFPVLSAQDTGRIGEAMLGPRRQEEFTKQREFDFSYVFNDQARFRVNVYFQKGTVGISLRLIPARVPTIDKLNLPSFLKTLAAKRQGFVLVTGPTGHGKSTTLAAIIEEINASRASHIITIEDPIEYYFQPKRSFFSQREMGSDTLSWSQALRAGLREDPDVVLVGEMRDLETISAALTVAETGHLVFATLHTNSAAETIDRIVDVFPTGAKDQVRIQLANSLLAVVSQRLVPTIKPGRVPAIEFLLNNFAVRTAIREGKTYMIDNIIRTSAEAGMFLLEASLADWVNKGVIDMEVAKQFTLREKELLRGLRRKNA